MLKAASFSFRSLKEKAFASAHPKVVILSVLAVLSGVLPGSAQENIPATTSPTPATTVRPETAKEKKAAEKENRKAAEKQRKAEKPAPVDPKNPTAEQVAETVIVIYGQNVAGRQVLEQIRKTAIERGKMSVTNPDGTIEKASYEKRIMRGETLDKERVRIDQETPSTKYALIYSDKKVVGLFNETVFKPRDDASKAFENQIWYGIDALLRYKENGATVKLDGHDLSMGVDYHLLDLTDKEGRKVRYHISSKSFRVSWLEYTEGGINYLRKFYDYRLAQNTLVPYRSVLFANGKQIEETQILTVTFGQKIEEETFKVGE